MRLVLISDTHDQNIQTKWVIPAGDVLIHVGDLTAVGDKTQRFDWGARNLGRLPHKVKLYVPGNHDKLAYRRPDLVRSIMARRGITMLFDEEFELEGKTFFGSPWMPYTEPGHVAEYQGNIGDVWRQAPIRCDVLLTHVPPAGILDWSNKGFGEHIGDPALTSAVLYRIMPTLHVFGHNHSKHGEALVGETRFINASLCDDDYKPAFEPITVDI